MPSDSRPLDLGEQFLFSPGFHSDITVLLL
jgi:hypothetical protein